MRALVCSVLSAVCLSSAAYAADEAKNAAKIFERACMNQAALSLHAGSSYNDGLKAAKKADEQFSRRATFARKNGLKESLLYKIKEDTDEGEFFCAVMSKTLSAKELVVHFPSLTKKLARSFGTPRQGKAAVDGDPSAQAEGRRSTFSSKGLKVEFEAIRFQPDPGPVAGFVMSIQHKI